MNAKKTQKTWRWLRISFSLRSLLLFTFLFAAVFGSWIASAQRLRALMDKIGSISEVLGLQMVATQLAVNLAYARLPLP